MRRGITDHYHGYERTPEEANAIARKVIGRTRFQLSEGKDPYEGRIYEPNKVATRIYEGEFEMDGELKPSKLKVQLLRPGIEEPELMRRFMAQNASMKIRAADIYADEPYNTSEECGYMITELIDGRPMFKDLLATDEERERWLEFYKEMREAAIMKPLFEAEWHERDARIVTGLRVGNWMNIARKQGHLDREKVGLSVRHLTQMTLGKVTETDFMHGHLNADSVLTTEKGERVLMSQAFWKFLPLYSDTVFHLWASLKSGRGKDIPTPEQALQYVETWLEDYKTLDLIDRDGEFDYYFASALRERCVGAIIVDIDSDARNDLAKVTKKLGSGQIHLYEAEMEREAIRDRVKELKDIFRALFTHYSKVKG